MKFQYGALEKQHTIAELTFNFCCSVWTQVLQLREYSEP